MDTETTPLNTDSAPNLVSQPEADSQTVEQCLTFLHRKDDTSRFVGLAMLSSFLTHIQDRAVLIKCWNALQPKFLDRLLRAGNGKKSAEEAKDMVELAVNVIHAFTTLLPDEEENDSLVGRIPGLVKALPGCTSVTAATILQTLLALSARQKGAEAILGISNLKLLVDITTEHEMGLQVLLYAFINASPEVMRSRLEGFLPGVCTQIENMDETLRLRVLKFLSDLLTRIPPKELPSDTSWVVSLYSTIATVLSAGHVSKARHYTIMIAASLLHRYPPTLLFESRSSSKSPASDKPFIYLFLQLTLIELRASFPSLLESLNTPTYAATSYLLASAFDIAAAFLGYLVSSETFTSMVLTPDLLLKLRSDLGETFGLTIEFLRDRWDAAYAGAEGFEPGHEDKGIPLSLTWESGLEGGLFKDPVVMAGVRALSLWLREEESLREEAGGLMDFFLGLWKKGAEEGIDYRVWVVAALEGVLEEEHGRVQFMKYQGWDIVYGDLKNTYNSLKPGEDDVRLAIAEARLLVEVVAFEARAEEEWVKDVVKLTNIKGTKGLRLELDAEVLKLASACIANVHKAVRKRLGVEVQKVRQVCQRLILDVQGKEEEETLGLVVEVVEELEALGL